MANPQNLKPFTGKDDPRRANGPKPGYKQLKTQIQEMMNDPNFELYLQDAKGGAYRQIKGAPLAAITKTAIIKAAAGDPVSREWLAKYGYGSQDKLTITSNPAREILEGAGLLEEGEDDDRQTTGDSKESPDTETQV